MATSRDDYDTPWKEEIKGVQLVGSLIEKHTVKNNPSVRSFVDFIKTLITHPQ